MWSHILVRTGASCKTLRVIREPSGAVGGEPFRVQPKVAVYDGADVSVDFVGHAYAILAESPARYQALHIGLCNSSDFCGERLQSDAIAKQFKVPFKDGVALFKGLQLKTAGSGYTIRFIGLTPSGSPFAYVDTTAFSVAVGSPYQLQFFQHHGPAWGGTVIALQPAVAIADRGNNVVGSTHSQYSITVSLATHPAGATLHPASQAGRTVEVSAGIAQFENLYINEAAKDYTFKFRCNQVNLISALSALRI